MLGPLILSSSRPAYSLRLWRTLDHCLMSKGSERVAPEVGLEPTTPRLTAERNYHCATPEYSSI